MFYGSHGVSGNGDTQEKESLKHYVWVNSGRSQNPLKVSFPIIHKTEMTASILYGYWKG